MNTLQRVSALQGSYDELRNHHEEETKKLNKETKELRFEKDKLTSQCKDAQAVNEMHLLTKSRIILSKIV